ncbi:neutral/alkaline non-lysosomal ceramidase N-terminal domain-containing protein [Nocardia sp. CA-135398]|uniref:neutral/alkaline non-lysosomal ceramidase N-terminal domain-containing protein n=1 Tax=Nocardia sp. CA-135398 TaxID=3239977 RepID=UPI003D987813
MSSYVVRFSTGSKGDAYVGVTQNGAGPNRGGLGRVAAATVPGLTAALGAPAAETGGYLIGLGLSDITGPAAECGMMGYSQFEQQTAGIHLRPRARAFIIDSGARRIVFAVAENGMIFQSVHRGVMLELARRFGDLYTEQNVVLTSTHSHATCGGSSNDYAYNLSILGFQQQVYDAEVNGIVEAIAAAHADLGPGALSLGRAELHDASVNHSRVAFERNPDVDKQHFPNAIDPAVTALSFVKGGKQVGAITWFATHNTSMTNQNRLISADNKGYASFSYEHTEHGVRYLDGPAQQYEGGSTLFGRYTLSAYQQEFTRLATAFAARQQVPRGPAPRDISNRQPNFQPAPGPDATPIGYGFGDILTQPAASYAPGTQAAAEFVSAHPKHNPRRDGTFLEVQRRNASGDWVRVANEGEWAVRFYWSKRGFPESVARFTWDIPTDATPGTYRMQHFADSLSPDGTLHPFTGTTNEFEVS